MKNNEMIYAPGLELVREDFKTALECRIQTKRYTQSILAQESGVNIRMIQHYEQGVKDINRAAALTVHRLAQARECKGEDLLEIK